MLLSCSAASVPSGVEDSAYTITLYRHAEKATGPDPDLTHYGQARARFLAAWHKDRDIGAIWSSDYQRTRNTALPLAEATGLDVSIYDPGNQDQLVADLHAAGVNAVVIGHSNTIPQLASMLCSCEVLPMEDTEYERSFVIIYRDGHTGITEPDLKKLWTARPVP